MKPIFVTALSCFLFLAAYCNAALAEQPIIPAPPELRAKAYVLVDADTGKVLVQYNADERLAPASLTKMMTGYVAATELQHGTVKLTDMVDVSVKAWKMEGSRMFIREGTKVRLDDLLRGMIVDSGNDASVALAQHIAGTEDAFVDLMNQHAARLGMANSHFMNATGLPVKDHYTTADDLAKLAVALIKDFPDHYELYSEKYFTYNNIRQPNRNALLWRDPSVDGVKTGHTDAAGFCLVASALRHGMRLVSVVMGTDSEEARATESQKLLTYGFRYYDTVHLYAAGKALKDVRVWEGEQDAIGVGLAKDAVVTIPRGSKKDLKASMDFGRVVKAPVKQGDQIGKLVVAMNGKDIYQSALLAVSAVDEAGFVKRLWDAIVLFFVQLFGGDAVSAS